MSRHVTAAPPGRRDVTSFTRNGVHAQQSADIRTRSRVLADKDASPSRAAATWCRRTVCRDGEAEAGDYRNDIRLPEESQPLFALLPQIREPRLVLRHSEEFGLRATVSRPYSVVKQCPDGLECTA
jgi:hypothetical protein